MDIQSKITSTLQKSELWIPGVSKDNGQTLSPLKCPACGKPEAWAYSKASWAIVCNRSKECGQSTKVRDLFPEIMGNVERDFSPTKAEPHRPAAAFLQMRGLKTSLSGLDFEYWRDVRKTGSGAVMFPVGADKKTWNGRLLAPPPEAMKGHNKGSTSGRFWRHPGKEYDPDKEVIVVEGIIDALSIFEMGGQAIAVLSSGQSPENLDLSEFKRLTFGFDNDPAGHRALKKWRGYFAAVPGVLVSAIMPPPGLDWNDLLNLWSHDEAANLFIKNRKEYAFHAALALAESAQEWAEKYFNHTGFPAGLFPFDGKYFFSTVKETKAGPDVSVNRCSNFILSVKHYQLSFSSPDEPVFNYHLTVKPQKGRERSFTSSAKEISTAGNLTAMFLERGRVLWEGNGQASLALARKIVETKAPEVRQLEITGRDLESDCFVFKYFMVDRQGKIIFPDKQGFFRVGNETFLRPAQNSNAVKPESVTGCARKIYDLIVKAWGDRGAAVVAWMVAGWFVEKIKKEIGFFPILSLFGDTQTGKSALTRVLNGMQALDEEGMPMRRLNTGKGELRKLAQRSGLFLAMLEGNNADSSRFDPDAILTLFNDSPLQVRARKSNDLSIHEIPFLASLVFVQNNEPFRTKAQRERVVSIEFKTGFQHAETAAAFAELSKIPKERLASFFIEVMGFRSKLESQWAAAYQAALERMASILPDPRLCGTHAVVLGFHELLMSILKIDFDLFPYLERAAIRKHKKCNQRDSDIGDFFFDVVFNLVETSGDSGQWCDLKEEKGELWLYLPGALKAAENKGNSIKAQLKDLQAALRDHPGYLKSNVSHRFRNGMVEEVRKAWLFDAGKMVTDDDLD